MVLGGAGGLNDSQARSRSIASALRYRRRDQTPRRRARPSLVGEQKRPHAGTLGERLEQSVGKDSGGPMPTATGRVAKDIGVTSGLSDGNHVDGAVNGQRHKGGDTNPSATEVMTSSRKTTSPPALDGVDTKLSWTISQEATIVASRAAAKAKASAEVGNLLMDIVGQRRASISSAQGQASRKEPSSDASQVCTRGHRDFIFF